jgi:hypothetical protein
MVGVLVILIVGVMDGVTDIVGVILIVGVIEGIVEQSVTLSIIPEAPTYTAHLLDPPNWNKYIPRFDPTLHGIVKVLSWYNWAPTVGVFPN